MKLVSQNVAQGIVEVYHKTFQPCDVAAVVNLAETIVALWPFVEWAKEQDCDRGDWASQCDCIPCQARKMRKEAKP